MARLYNIDSQLHGVNGFGLQFSDNIYSATLAADTDTSFTVPGTDATGSIAGNPVNRFVAIFSYGDGKDVWVNINAAAAAPVGASIAAGSELNPEARTVKAGDVIHMKCVAGGVISISLYSVQN